MHRHTVLHHTLFIFFSHWSCILLWIHRDMDGLLYCVRLYLTAVHPIFFFSFLFSHSPIQSRALSTPELFAMVKTTHCISIVYPKSMKESPSMPLPSIHHVSGLPVSNEQIKYSIWNWFKISKLQMKIEISNCTNCCHWTHTIHHNHHTGQKLNCLYQI